ncbi:hypothetical protein ACQ33O_09840 [Ferruginibacter sp. SUN002]|uniref:hypothetical protein n=1 Tax=Ferruginibacter sp. SUN002 TaxID=2937789 RepID=UPI003D364F30
MTLHKITGSLLSLQLLHDEKNSILVAPTVFFIQTNNNKDIGNFSPRLAAKVQKINNINKYFKYLQYCCYKSIIYAMACGKHSGQPYSYCDYFYLSTPPLTILTG